VTDIKGAKARAHESASGKRKRHQRESVQALMGTAAEQYLVEQEPSIPRGPSDLVEGGSCDMEQAKSLGLDVGVDAPVWIAECQSQAHELVRSPRYWAAITAVANELIRVRRLGQRKARRIIRKTLIAYGSGIRPSPD
jgi:hypothetical protein